MHWRQPQRLRHRSRFAHWQLSTTAPYCPGAHPAAVPDRAEGHAVNQRVQTKPEGNAQPAEFVGLRGLMMVVVVFVNISLTAHGRQNLAAFEKEIRLFPEVLECYTVTGQMDYLLKIVTKDIQHYESFIRNQLMTLPMIREMHSTIAVTEIKDTTELPLETQI